MIKKIRSKISNIRNINKTNKQKDCNISIKSSIDSFSEFEGKNIVYERTTIVGTSVGFATYIGSSCRLVNTKIGKYCSIGSNVKIIAGNHPTSKYISTHPLFYSKNFFSGLNFNHDNSFNEYKYTDTKENFFCEIGNDVWIGESVKILNGVSIGNGAIIGTGAVVIKDVPPYAVVGGVPAKIIRYRFSQEDIAFLNELQWWKKDLTWIEKKSIYFNDIDRLKKYGGAHEISKQNY